MTEALIVQAVFSFKGANNDELCFKKGDKIIVTQKEDGGWWEGTLGEKTGWFPSNYVRECKEPTSPLRSPTDSYQQKQYRDVVIKDLIESEKAHINEMKGLVVNFLEPLEKTNILSVDEYKQLISNINEIIEVHSQLLNAVLECTKKSSNEQRVGKIFMQWAPKLKSVHHFYCTMHPRAVCVLDKYKLELSNYMESAGAATPGILVLTTGLSKPFRRLDKYPGILQEMERHVEENHVDRGDTQRSVAVYKDIAMFCANIRRQKELELQVLTGPVKGWEGQSLALLGDIINMTAVKIGPKQLDRYLVLFPSTVLMLSVSQRMSSFIYEGQLPITGISVTKTENEQYKNAFEINGNFIEKIVVQCQTNDEAQTWVDLLQKHNNSRLIKENGDLMQKSLQLGKSVINGSPKKMEKPESRLPPISNGTINGLKRAHTFTYSNVLLPSSKESSQILGNQQNVWNVSRLRPMIPKFVPRRTDDIKENLSPKRKQTSYEDDALILRVVEAYFNANKVRNTITADSNGTDKNTVVTLLQEHVNDLQQKLDKVTLQINEETIARCALQKIIKNYLVNVGTNIDKILWPKEY